MFSKRPNYCEENNTVVVMMIIILVLQELETLSQTEIEKRAVEHLVQLFPAARLHKPRTVVCSISTASD